MNKPIDKIWEEFCIKNSISFNNKIKEIQNNPGYSHMDDMAEWHSYLTTTIEKFCEYNNTPVSKELISMIVCICVDNMPRL